MMNGMALPFEEEGYTPGDVGGSGYGFFDAGSGARTPRERKGGDSEHALSQSKPGRGFSLSVGRRLLDADR